jgi:hypothetical protein
MNRTRFFRNLHSPAARAPAKVALFFTAVMGFVACNAESQFKGSAAAWSGIQVEKATSGYDEPNAEAGRTPPGETAAGAGSTGIQIACDSSTAKVYETSSLHIPVVCSTEAKSSSVGFFDMDVVFVLDTTGSMRKYVDLIKRNLNSLKESAERNGFQLRMGAISYGDEIFDTRPLSENIAELTTAMLDSNPLWMPSQNRGGDVPEIGLAAIEKGVELLQQGSGKSKVLVFYTDAPSKRFAQARDSLAASFAVGATAEKLRAAASSVQRGGGFFRVASGTSCERTDGWFSEWPTPCEQISRLASSAGVSHLPLIFGNSDANYDADFVSAISNRASTITVDCKLSAVSMVSAKGETFLPQTSLSPLSGGMWRVPIEAKIPPGRYTFTITRACENFTLTQKVTADIAGT